MRVCHGGSTIKGTFSTGELVHLDESNRFGMCSMSMVTYLIKAYVQLRKASIIVAFGL